MRRRVFLILLLGSSAASLFLGCGAPTATVSGQVAVDGQPLEKGTISYAPADGRGAPVTVPIENGKYQARTTPGNKFVQISAPKVMGKRKEHNGPDAPLVEITAESLPPRYNSKTELSLDVHAGSNTKDWSVTSQLTKP
jgi:hypothetical protein